MFSPPAAQLRVFVDVDDLPSRDREEWRSYLDADGGVTRGEAATIQNRFSAALVVDATPRTPQAALVRRAGKRRLVCPLDLQTRTSWAWGQVQSEVSPSVQRGMLPNPEVRDTLSRSARSARAPTILDHAWEVPLHWYSCFAPEEGRRTDATEGEGPRVRYLTTVGQAADRVDRLIRIVTQHVAADPDGTLTRSVELAGWLDAFPDDALLELDYGMLATRIHPGQDHACRDLQASLDALEAGDLLGAVTGYGVARACWSTQRDHVRQN